MLIRVNDRLARGGDPPDPPAAWGDIVPVETLPTPGRPLHPRDAIGPFQVVGPWNDIDVERQERACPSKSVRWLTSGSTRCVHGRGSRPGGCTRWSGCV